MKPLIPAFFFCAGLLVGVSATAAPDYPTTGTPGKLVESVDSGGGGSAMPAQPVEGSASVRRAHNNDLDLLRNAINGSSDPAAPAAATPRRPIYRWQSLVPGAIK